MTEGQNNNFISLAQASQLCSYSQEYLSLRARQGKLKAKKMGRDWMTTKEWLSEYLVLTNPEPKSSQERGNKLILLQEAAKLTPYSQEYLSLRVRQGKLQAKKQGRNWYTTEEWIREYAERVKQFETQRRALKIEAGGVQKNEIENPAGLNEGATRSFYVLFQQVQAPIHPFFASNIVSEGEFDVFFKPVNYGSQAFLAFSRLKRGVAETLVELSQRIEAKLLNWRTAGVYWLLRLRALDQNLRISQFEPRLALADARRFRAAFLTLLLLAGGAFFAKVVPNMNLGQKTQKVLSQSHVLAGNAKNSFSELSQISSQKKLHELIGFCDNKLSDLSVAGKVVLNKLNESKKESVKAADQVVWQFKNAGQAFARGGGNVRDFVLSVPPRAKIFVAETFRNISIAATNAKNFMTQSPRLATAAGDELAEYILTVAQNISEFPAGVVKRYSQLSQTNESAKASFRAFLNETKNQTKIFAALSLSDFKNYPFVVYDKYLEISQQVGNTILDIGSKTANGIAKLSDLSKKIASGLTGKIKNISGRKPADEAGNNSGITDGTRSAEVGRIPTPSQPLPQTGGGSASSEEQVEGRLPLAPDAAQNTNQNGQKNQTTIVVRPLDVNLIRQVAQQIFNENTGVAPTGNQNYATRTDLISLETKMSNLITQSVASAVTQANTYTTNNFYAWAPAMQKIDNLSSLTVTNGMTLSSGDLRITSGGINQSGGSVNFSGNVAMSGGLTTTDLMIGGNATIAGNLAIAGALHDSLGSVGSDGMILQTIGSGVKWVATSTLGIVSGGVGQWDISGSDLYYLAGNVGIGTSGPEAKLHVDGSSKFSGSLTMAGNILADNASQRNIGASGTPFSAIYVDEVFMSGNSLYMNGSKVLESLAAVMNFTADQNQTLQVQTSGSGNLQFDSAGSGNVLMTTTGTGDVVLDSKDQVQITSANAMSLEAISTNSDININARGANSQVRISAIEEVDITVPYVDINGNMDVSGAITLHADPTLAMQVATKQYVDAHSGAGTFFGSNRHAVFLHRRNAVESQQRG